MTEEKDYLKEAYESTKAAVKAAHRFNMDNLKLADDLRKEAEADAIALNKAVVENVKGALDE